MESYPNWHNTTVNTIYHTHWLQPNNEPLTYSWHFAFAVVGVCVFIASLAGNLLVMFLFVRCRSLRSFSNLFVLNVTVADFLLCISNIPMFIIASFSGSWRFEEIGCQIYAFFGTVASCVSINSLAAIAVDRCLVITKTFSMQTRSSGRPFYLAVACIWVYAILWATAPLIGWGRYILEGANTSCTFDYLSRNMNNIVYVISMASAHFLVPVSVISCAYFLIFKTVQRHRIEFASFAADSFRQDQSELSRQNLKRGRKNELQTAKISLIIVLVFCVSWFPYAIVALIGEFGDRTLITRLVAGIPCLCAKFSTVMNPLIYALLHPKFRKKLSDCFVGCETTESRSNNRSAAMKADCVRRSPMNIRRFSFDNGKLAAVSSL